MNGRDCIGQRFILDQNYIHLKNLIIVMYLQVLGYHNHQKLMQYSWNYMNDSLRTDVFVRYQPETVACACIYLTARKLKLPLPKNPAWYTIFGATEEEIRDISLRILRLYCRPKPEIEALEKKVEDLCKKYQEAKAKARKSRKSTDREADRQVETTRRATKGKAIRDLGAIRLTPNPGKGKSGPGQEATTEIRKTTDTLRSMTSTKRTAGIRMIGIGTPKKTGTLKKIGIRKKKSTLIRIGTTIRRTERTSTTEKKNIEMINIAEKIGRNTRSRSTGRRTSLITQRSI
nr:unnamed protein product [Callosobruchus analis]